MFLYVCQYRAINFRGGLGDKLFFTTVFESQGRFADYFNRYAESIKPAGKSGNYTWIGIANFKTILMTFLWRANLTFTASKHIDLQLGYGRNFW
jgi:hypothetical protein